MTWDDPEDPEIVDGWVRRLGQPAPEPVLWQRLQGGASGSRVYRLQLHGGDVVLKVTLATANSAMRERARREARFYRELAHRVPLRVPTARAVHDGVAGVAILLAAYDPSPPPYCWPEDRFVAVAAQLGRFHAAFWDDETGLTRYPWLRRSAPLTENRRRQAIGQWRDLARQERLRSVLTGARAQRVCEALQGRPPLLAQAELLPPTLCHGDCHTGNILGTPIGEPIWADWQEVGVDRGATDLAFLCQRALFAGAAVPYDPVVRAYCVGLDGAGRLGPREVVESALAAAEVRSWLVAWPPYLALATTEQLSRVLERIDCLVARLGRGLGD